MHDVMFGSDGVDHRVLTGLLCNVYKGLNIVHFNARSLSGAKLDYVRYVFATGKVDIVCVTETWFSNEVPDSMYNIDNYYLLRNDRLGKRGGGVAIYCRAGLKVKLVGVSNNTEVEFINIEILGKTKLLIFCVYNPHRQYSLDPFFDDLSYRITSYDDNVVCGDFNINYLAGDAMTSAFLTKVQTLGLEVVNTNVPPRYSNCSMACLLDMFLVSDTSLLNKFDQLTFISDHDLIFCSIDIEFDNGSKPVAYSYRDYHD